MFGLTECAVDKVAVKVKDIDGRLLRCVRVTLGHKFDDDLASDLGSDAGHMLEGLRGEALSAVSLNIGALKLHGAFRAPNGSEITVPHMLGIKATAKAAKSPDVEDPRIEMEFEFIFQPEAWGFFGEFCAGTVHTEFQESQTAFDFSAALNADLARAGKELREFAKTNKAKISTRVGKGRERVLVDHREATATTITPDP